MGLSTTQTTGSFEGGGIKITDGVYANLLTIKKVKDLSGKKLDFLDNQVFDLAIEVEYEDERFPVTYFGNLKTDASGEVTGWGGAFVVGRIFAMAGIEAELDINNRFEASDLKELIGKDLYVITYTAGTYKKDDGTRANSYKKWNLVFSAQEDPEELPSVVLDEWQRSRAKGYPKDYTLPMNTNKSGGGLSTSSKSAAGMASATSGVEISDDIDDDLPF